eukprot:437658_1
MTQMAHPIASHPIASHVTDDGTVSVFYDRWNVPIITPGCIKGAGRSSRPNEYHSYLTPLVEQGKLVLADWRRSMAYFTIPTPESRIQKGTKNDFFQFWYRSMPIEEFNYLMVKKQVQDASQVGLAARYNYIYSPQEGRTVYYPTTKPIQPDGSTKIVYKVIVRFDLGSTITQAEVEPGSPPAPPVITGPVHFQKQIHDEGWHHKDDSHFAIGIGSKSANVGALKWFNDQIAAGLIKYEAIRFSAPCPISHSPAKIQWDELDNLAPTKPISYKQYIHGVHDFEQNIVELNANFLKAWTTMRMKPSIQAVMDEMSSHKAHQEYADYEYDYDFVKSEMLPIGYNDYEDFGNVYRNGYSSNISMIVSVLSVFILCGIICCICFVCGCIVGYFAPKQPAFKNENNNE